MPARRKRRTVLVSCERAQVVQQILRRFRVERLQWGSRDRYGPSSSAGMHVRKRTVDPAPSHQQHTSLHVEPVMLRRRRSCDRLQPPYATPISIMGSMSTPATLARSQLVGWA